MVFLARRILSVLPALCVLCSAPAVAQVIKVTSEDSLEPLKPLFDKLLRNAGFEPQIRTYPGERSFQMMRRGEVDMEYTRTKTAVASIRDSVTLVGPVGCIEGVTFTRSDAPIPIEKASDLENFKIGVPFVHKTAIAYAAENKLNVEIVNQRDSLFKMLDARRFSLVVDALVAGLRSIDAAGLQGKIVQTGPVLFSEPVYLVVSNTHPDWAARVQKAFDTLLHSGAWRVDVANINKAAGLPKKAGLACLKE